MDRKIRVTIWNEFRHEKTDAHVKELYPDGLHAYIKNFLEATGDIEVTLAALDDPEQGLPQELIDNTDVLMWWGHMFHGEVTDETVNKVKKAVFAGMGFIPMHSAHQSKPFQAILGTEGNLQWGDVRREVVWNMLPEHPIAAGIPKNFVLPKEELYAEPFSIPRPDEIVFASWFEDGFIFRSGCCWYRNAGKVFYFQPGHEEVPTYYNEYVQKILINAVHWAAPANYGFEIPRSCNYTADKF